MQAGGTATRLLAAAALAAGALVPAALATTATHERAPGPWCGGTAWRRMTLSDADRAAVDTRPRLSSILQLSRLAAPVRPSARRSYFERHTWHLRTVIDRYRVASNGEIVLVLYSIDSAQYMDAYMPNPACLSSRTRNRADIVAARRAFTSACGEPKPTWQLLGVTVELSGVGFWNPVLTTRGALSNGAELRPVTAFKLIVGCGVS